MVGDGFDANTTIGPLIDGKAVAKIESHVRDALAKGARLVAGGKHLSRGGNFFEPTVLASCRPDMAAFSEETFGPLAPVFGFKTEANAIAMANDTPFGLGLPEHQIRLHGGL